jgi:hypothetical protein
MFKLFTNDYNTGGIFSLTATAVWALNFFACTVLIKQAHTAWKTSGGDKQLETEMNRAAVGGAMIVAQHQNQSQQLTADDQSV